MGLIAGRAPALDQESLFDVPGQIVAAGIVYLMTDWYLLKWGFSSRATPKPRSGELRASVIGFMPGTRGDEKSHLASVKRWTEGGEWFRVPDDPQALWSLMNTAKLLGQWQGIPATESLARVIANNLRMRRAA